MADSGPERLHPYEQSIGIAVYADFSYFQHMPARFPLFPEFVARAGEKYDFAGSPRFPVRLLIHEPQHEHVAGGVVLNDGRHQSAGFIEVNFHLCSSSKRCPKTKKPAGLCARSEERRVGKECRSWLSACI